MNGEVSVAEAESKIKWSFQQPEKMNSIPLVSSGLIQLKDHKVVIAIENGKEIYLTIRSLPKLCNSISFRIISFWSWENKEDDRIGRDVSQTLCMEKRELPFKMHLNTGSFEETKEAGEKLTLVIELDVLSTSNALPNCIPSSFRSQLLFHMKMEEFTDMIFITREKWRIPAHRVVMVLASPVFKAMLSGKFIEGSTKEVEIDLPRLDLEILLEHAYLGCTPSLLRVPDICALIHVFEAAEMYLMANLQNATICEIKHRVDKNYKIGVNHAEEFRRLLQFISKYHSASVWLRRAVNKHLISRPETLVEIASYNPLG